MFYLNIFFKSQINRKPYGFEMHANKDKLKPTEEQPGIGWINKTHFLLGNLIIDIETMRVSFCMHLSTYDDYFLTLS